MQYEYSRIFRNTIFLYIRMLLIMAASLYMSRIVLDALGVIDFGIYNVVGGLSTSFIFFSSAFINATQRFLNFELGRNSTNGARNVFSLSLLIHTVLAAIVVIAGSIIGTWYINNKLVLPFEQIPSAQVVLYSMLVSLAFTFVGAVYEAVLIAHENMKIYAWLGLLDAFTKLGVAFIIQHLSSDRLIIYAVLLAAVKVIYTIILIWYCRTRYEESDYSFFWNKSLFKQLLYFIGWNAYGTGVWAANIQGINLLFNWFFGPVINAANAIAQQVNSAVNNFCTNFFTAIKPQIIKSYAAADHKYFISLIFTSSRLAVYLMWMITLPILLRTEYILNIWLKEVPSTTEAFVHGTLIYAMICTLHNPLWTATMAIGKLKNPVFYGNTIFAMALPVSYILLRMGFPAASTYVGLIIFRIGFLAVTYIHISKYTDIRISQYLSKVILPCICIVSVSLSAMILINRALPQNFISLVAVTVLSLIFTVLLIWCFGITSTERSFIRDKIIKQCKKYCLYSALVRKR